MRREPGARTNSVPLQDLYEDARRMRNRLKSWCFSFQLAFARVGAGNSV